MLKKWLNENLQKEFIHPSTFFISSSVIFVHKSGEDIQICVNYWKLNNIIIKNWYPILWLQKTLNYLTHVQFFIKLNIISVFHKLHNKKKDEWKTAFHIWYRLFESLIMFFRLCNGPSSFQSFINEVFYNFLNVFCTAYLNDILIYSDNKKKHNEHVCLILTCLQEFRLYVNIEKYVFKIWEVLYLSFFIEVNSICMNS